MPWVALALVLSLGGVTSRSPEIDAVAVQGALEIRAGERARSWTIDLEAGAGGEVHARLRDVDGRELQRTYVLSGTTDEERSRELAAALALVLEREASAAVAAAPPRKVAPKPVVSVATTAGWIAVGGRLALGGGPTSDGGATLRGGLSWGRRILQPLAYLGSLHARRGALALDGVRAGAGLAVGSPWRAWWFGGSVVPGLVWARARDRARDDAIGSLTEFAALTQWRGRRGLFLAARVGLDVAAPALRAVGRADTLRVGQVRFVAGLEVGLVLPPGKQR